MPKPLPPFECSYQGQLLAGVDEVGRGPLVGAVVASAVILDPGNPIEGLVDSKKISEKKRERLFDEIIEKALSWSICRASVEEIDSLNILHASMLAMKRAVEALETAPEYVLVDGNRCPDIGIPCEPVVKGDDRVACISAASILAKVSRDREMIELDRAFPEYGLAKHKGYPTKAHLEAIKEHGISRPEVFALYRKSFKPVATLLSN